MDRREFRFYPLTEFYWYRDENDPGSMIGKYLPGNSYNCTAGARHDALREKCKQWEADGLIRIAYLAPGRVFQTQKVGG